MSKHLVKKIKNWLNEYNPFEDEGLYSSNISEIWLVGSRAKNTHQENSDYDIAVIFEYSKSFPEQDVKSLADDFKTNPLAFHILRRLGVNFMRMIPMKENEQQKASEILNISMKKQRLIGGTSSIKK